MQILAIFAVFALGLDAVSVGICSIIERYSEYASLIAFLGFFSVNFMIAWMAAVYVTERYLLTDAQKLTNAEDVRKTEALFKPVPVQPAHLRAAQLKPAHA